MRLLGGFHVRTGKGRDGSESFIQVPVRYGDITRMAAHIMKNQSENMINTVPFISCYVTDLQVNAERRTNPTHVDTVQVYEKKFDSKSGQYIDGTVGNTYSIERHVPVPYDLTVQVDIWTSNNDQKLQLLEQLLVLFNPSVNLKTNSNPFDWTSLTYAELINIVWSSRTVAQGTDDIIDVAALNFLLPIFINPPAKIKRQTLVHTILTEIKKVQGDGMVEWDPNEVIAKKEWMIITFEDLKLQVKIEGNNASILNKSGGLVDDDGNLLSWIAILQNYGEFRPGISNIRLRRGDDPIYDGNDIVLIVDELSQAQANLAKVSVDIDSLPATTMASVDAIINPRTSGPGINLPNAASGQRYLILEDVPEGSMWGTTTAKANDVIQYNGSEWVVSFDSAGNSSAVVLNTTTSIIYEWRSKQWISVFEGTYRNGWWRLYL